MSKVVYITSYGHSGSTLLDMLSGTIPGCFSTGELLWFPWQIYRNGKMCSKKQDICSCGKPFTECEVWSKVLSHLFQRTGIDVAKNPFDFAMNILGPIRYGRQNRTHSILKRLFYETSFQGAGPLWDLALKKRVDLNWFLFEELSKITKSHWIIDSSKDVARMAALYRSRPDDVRIIILIRSATGILNSRIKLGIDPQIGLDKWLNFYNDRVSSVINRLPKDHYMILQYEDYVGNPSKARRKIAGFLQLEDPGDNYKILSSENHLIAGNAMRFRGEIEINYDDEWRKVLSLENLKLAEHYSKRLHPFFA